MMSIRASGSCSVSVGVGLVDDEQGFHGSVLETKWYRKCHYKVVQWYLQYLYAAGLARVRADASQRPAAMSCAVEPTVRNACSSSAVHGAPALSRRQFRYRVEVVNSGPGTTMMRRSMQRR